jgi:hypothetical protein
LCFAAAACIVLSISRLKNVCAYIQTNLNLGNIKCYWLAVNIQTRQNQTFSLWAAPCKIEEREVTHRLLCDGGHNLDPSKATEETARMDGCLMEDVTGRRAPPRQRPAAAPQGRVVNGTPCEQQRPLESGQRMFAEFGFGKFTFVNRFF